MFFIKLVGVALSWSDHEKFHREKNTLLHGLYKWKIRPIKCHVVATLEVLFYGNFLVLVRGLDEAFELVRSSGHLAESLDGVQFLAFGDLVFRHLFGEKLGRLTLSGTVHGPDFILSELSQVFERRGLDRVLSRTPNHFLAFMHEIIDVVTPSDLRSEGM